MSGQGVGNEALVVVAVSDDGRAIPVPLLEVEIDLEPGARDHLRARELRLRQGVVLEPAR